ncbi:GNAT family N-acetyltransferase [Microtetraspora malaysiensis]|uniref:GNAT family N-acetyltransferase n=1 Tax=Microtetraspora malaysiensis TaxID=161358 RepID=UPI00082EE2D8|nr:GNAT family N-acetyltransferase [Microtetraspora malaysiensis]
MSFGLRLARRDDVDELIFLRDEAATWLRKKGSDQWASTWRGDADHRRRLLVGVDLRATWMVTWRGRPVATVTVYDEDHPGIWRRAPHGHEPALYLHRLIVSRRIDGCRGLGGRILDWAVACAELGGAGWLRVDVWTTNTRLHDYYKGKGFVPAGLIPMDVLHELDWDDYPSRALFQRKLAPRKDPAFVMDEAAAGRLWNQMVSNT